MEALVHCPGDLPGGGAEVSVSWTFDTILCKTPSVDDVVMVSSTEELFTTAEKKII